MGRILRLCRSVFLSKSIFLIFPKVHKPQSRDDDSRSAVPIGTRSTRLRRGPCATASAIAGSIFTSICTARRRTHSCYCGTSSPARTLPGAISIFHQLRNMRTLSKHKTHAARLHVVRAGKPGAQIAVWSVRAKRITRNSTVRACTVRSLRAARRAEQQKLI